ncbi:hypothetical protein [Acetobacter oryzoeni]|uniref:hypothetical protein n=1 Tax=Acetobacter oryzoeni TaxID=2500548 RepID=UPI003DA95844
MHQLTKRNVMNFYKCKTAMRVMKNISLLCFCSPYNFAWADSIDRPIYPPPVSPYPMHADTADLSGRNIRSLADRASDIIDLNDYVTKWDGSEYFKAQIAAALSSVSPSSIITLPCGTKWPLYGNDGFAWAPRLKYGVLFMDVCGASWNNPAPWNTPALDRGLGDNNPVLTQYNGTVMLSRTNLSAANSIGLLTINMINATKHSGNAWPGNVQSDAMALQVHAIQPEYSDDGKTPTHGSSVGGIFDVKNFSHDKWSVQAQGLKISCTNYVNGSCWGVAINANDFSGRRAGPWSVINENDMSTNGPEIPEASYDPKQSAKIMMYNSAIAYHPPPWTPHKRINANAHETVLLEDMRGNKKILIATNNGVTGDNKPLFYGYEGSVLHDGTAIWQVGTTYDSVVGVVDFINNDKDNSDSSHNSYNFGWSTNASFNNAIFDASHAIMNTPRAVALRMAAEQRIDFNASPQAKSDEDLNKNTIYYSNKSKSLEYISHENTILKISDDGNVKVDGNISVSGKVDVGVILKEHGLTREEILSIPYPSEGMSVFNKSDHIFVDYACLHGSGCGWYSRAYGNMIKK